MVHLAVGHDAVQRRQHKPIVNVPRAETFQCVMHSTTHFRIARLPNIGAPSRTWKRYSRIAELCDHPLAGVTG
jgi:hypothetical protein